MAPQFSCRRSSSSCMTVSCWRCRARPAGRQRAASPVPLLQRGGGGQLVRNGGACFRVSASLAAMQQQGRAALLVSYSILRQHAVTETEASIPYNHPYCHCILTQTLPSSESRRCLMWRHVLQPLQASQSTRVAVNEGINLLQGLSPSNASIPCNYFGYVRVEANLNTMTPTVRPCITRCHLRMLM